jgi:pilus assembly protein Flp/PilA
MLQLWIEAQTRLAGDDERGAAAVEYGLMVGLIGAVIVLTVTALGGKINTAFDTVVKALP